MGRVTYAGMEEVWPTADQDPESTPPMVDFAGIWRDVPKVVYSRTLERVGPNATLVRDVVPEEVRALKAQPGGDMTLGGANLAATFERLGLVDEYRLYLNPVSIGRGRPVFPTDTRLPFRLAETRTFGNGVVLLRYERPDELAGHFRQMQPRVSAPEQGGVAEPASDDVVRGGRVRADVAGGGRAPWGRGAGVDVGAVMAATACLRRRAAG